MSKAPIILISLIAGAVLFACMSAEKKMQSTQSTNTAGTANSAATQSKPSIANPQAASTAAPSMPVTATVPQNDLGLQQVISNPERYPIQIDNRSNVVLGSKSVTYPGVNQQNLMAVRDNASGQVSWYGQGLQFSVASKEDFAAVQASYPKLEILVATTSFVNAKLDLNELTNYYNAMQSDARVQNLKLLPIEYPAKPR